MSKTLIIPEKPSVAADVAKSLGGFSKKEGYWESDTAIIASAIGHLVELHVPEAETAGYDLSGLPVIPKAFGLQAIDKTKAQFKLLKSLMQRPDVTTLVNACDAGREGELIFRLIVDLAGCRKPAKRMWLQSMTPDAIRTAYREMRPGVEYDALADAARSRAEADWLVGINGSRGVSRLRQAQTRTRTSSPVGRVQTPTLAIVVDRELAIRNFVAQDFWEVQGTFGLKAGSYTAKWFNPSAAPVAAQDKEGGTPTEDEQSGSRFTDRAKAQAIVDKCKGVAPTSVRDTSKKTSSAPPRLFDLTTLQREANKRYKISAKRTLDAAQALYEKHKATSYPRTDSTALPEDYVAKVGQIMGALKEAPYAEHAQRVIKNGWVKPNKRIFDNSKISDHFAIIPTGVAPGAMSADESKVYDLIVRRFLAAFHPAAEYHVTTRITEVAAELFRCSGKVLVEPGWLAIYGQSADEEKDKTPVLCALQPGEAARNEKIELKAGKTKAPSRFNEASLLGAMEGAGKLIDDDELRDAMSERGLGTPATRAAIIEGLLMQRKRKDGGLDDPYLNREGKAQELVPTEKAMALIAFLRDNGLDLLTSPKLTGDWEHRLRMMEKKSYERQVFMSEIAEFTRGVIDAVRKKAASLPALAPAAPIDVPCPSCGGKLNASERTYDCAAGCGFKLWREVAGRPLSQDEARTLLSKKEVGPLQGFTSKAGKPFSASLKLGDDGKVSFAFDNTQGQPGGSAGGTPGKPIKAPCPSCGAVVEHRGSLYACTACDFKVWGEICKHRLTAKEIDAALRKGATDKIEDFVSPKTGKTFSAILKLSGDKKKIEFDFGPRK
jgi:DNA topoisomerase-3